VALAAGAALLGGLVLTQGLSLRRAQVASVGAVPSLSSYLDGAAANEPLPQDNLFSAVLPEYPAGEGTFGSPAAARVNAASRRFPGPTAGLQYRPPAGSHGTLAACTNTPQPYDTGDFAPAPRSSGSLTPPVVQIAEGDIQLPPCYHDPQVLTFSVTAPGDVEAQFSPFTDPNYPLSPDLTQLRGCLIYDGEAGCTVAPLPATTFFSISTQDVQNHGTYRLLLLDGGPAPLGFFRVDLYFTAAQKHVRYDELSLDSVPGGCLDAADYDYFGCEAIFFWPGGAPGSAGAGPSFTSRGSFSVLIQNSDPALNAASCRSTVGNGRTYTCTLPPSPPSSWWSMRLVFSGGRPGVTGMDVVTS
jgi:hypothetical protein